MSDSICEGMDLYEWRASCKRAEIERDKGANALRDSRAEVKRLRDIATQFLAIVTAIDAARYPGLKCRICGRNYDHFPDCRLEALRQLAESAKACQKEDER